MDQELETLERYIEETRTRFNGKRLVRESNQQENIEYPSEEYLNNLDSSIKKNSALVKRLKVFTESQKDLISSEIDRLNLTKFISEVASSIIETKLKLSDIPAVIEICNKLNRTYKEFSRNLLDQYSKYFPTIKGRSNDTSTLAQSGTNSTTHLHLASSSRSLPSSSQAPKSLIKGQVKSSSDGDTLNRSKLRVDLRLFSELIISGIFPLKDGFPILMNLLCYLLIHDKNSHQHASAILTFCKGCGDELLGLVPSSIQQSAIKYGKHLPTSDLIPLKRQEQLKAYIRDYYQSLQRYLRSLHDELSDLVVRNKRTYKSRGEITKESKDVVNMKLVECQKVQNVLQQLADLLGETLIDLPDFSQLKEETYESNVPVEAIGDAGALAVKSSSVWDDEGTRSFYEDLLDLKATFPNLVVKIASGRKNTESQTREKKGEESESLDLTITDKDVNVDGDTESRDSTPTKGTDDSVDDLDKSLSSSSSEESLNNDDSVTPQSGGPVVNKAVGHRAPEQYFVKLSNCVNRDMIDNAAIDFIAFFNTKFGRRRLVKTLFNVQRTRLDLLPFFARLTATLYPYVPSVGNELVSQLRQDFRTLFRKKDQINIESKVKNVRFIGELVKFNLYAKQEALICLKMLLSDFTHHHIEMTCNLLETCGRLLYKSTDSHHQLRLLLEQMMRKKLLLSVDSKYVTMIENAYYFTNPPEVIRHIIEEPPVHTYVRYLLCECLNRSTIDKVLQKIKKLNWNDKTLTKFVIKCMIEAYNLKFYNIRYLAALLAALNKDHSWISVAVIDGVVEDILLMMEINELHYNQRRIPMIRYFGELYNYRLSDSSLVFKVLYSLITYGVYYPEPEQTLNQIPMSQLDLPDNLFRIKLVCDLLDTCGQYLSSGQEKKKLDCYLLFFQRYYWCKKHIYLLHPYCLAKGGNHFPSSIEYLYNDAIFNLRPTFQMATSYSEAIRAVKSFVDTLIANQPTS